MTRKFNYTFVLDVHTDIRIKYVNSYFYCFHNISIMEDIFYSNLEGGHELPKHRTRSCKSQLWAQV